MFQLNDNVVYETKEHCSHDLSDIVELLNPIDNQPMKWFNNEFTRKN